MSPESSPRYIAPLTVEEGLEDYYAEKQGRLDEIHDRWMAEGIADSCLENDRFIEDDDDDFPY